MSIWCRLSRACGILVVCVGMVSTTADGVDLYVNKDAWENAPRVDLVCRAYGGAMGIFWQVFMPTYLLFWPISTWTSSGLVLVLDDDSPGDHRVGTILQNLALNSKIEVKYEAPPPQGTTCTTWRREGYSRQQWSNFYADLYTDADFVAIIDTDAAFIAPVLPQDLFKEGKPKVKGINAYTRWESDVTAKAIGGHESIGRFMTQVNFPVILKSSHLQDMREDITANLGASTFEEAFHMICSAGRESYSQFEIMMNYLWYNKREEYSWHIADPESAKVGAYLGGNKRLTEDSDVLTMNIPTMLIMLHWDKKASTLDDNTYENVCIGSNFTAGSCGKDADLARRADNGAQQTRMWSVGNTRWEDTHEEHVRQVVRSGAVFDWRQEEPADHISIRQ